MIHVAPKSVGSDGTTATSPPFSPFSPATSVASDNTGTSDEPADLGAFHSVFRALSQLQVAHPRTMASLAIEEDDDTDHFYSDSEHSVEVVARDMHHLGSDTASDSEGVPAYTYDVESAVEAEDSRTIWNHEPIAAYLVSAATPAPAQQAARLRLGHGTYVDAPHTTAHEALLSQTHQQALAHSRPFYTPSVPRTPGPGDPTLGALEQALGFLAAERTRVASQLDSSIEEYAYRTEGKRRRRRRKKGVRDDSAPVGMSLAGLALARSSSTLHLKSAPRSNSNSGSAHERTDTAVPSPSEGTSFSSSSADPRGSRRSYLRDPDVPPVPMLHQPRAPNIPAYSAAINPNALAHEIIASYSVPTPPPTGRRAPRRRGPSFEPAPAFVPARAPVPFPGYDPSRVIDPRMQSIGQRLSGGSGSGSSPTNMGQSGENKVARLKLLATNLARHFPEDAGALRRAAEGGGGTGFERQESLLYVFVDHSNILVGFLEYIKKNPQLLPPSVGAPKRLKPKILHTALVLLLERGRPCARRILVASSPLHQTLDGVVGMGYEVSVLQRVEIKEGDEGASRARNGEFGSSEDDARAAGMPALPGAPPGAPPGALLRANSTNARRGTHHRRTSSEVSGSTPQRSRYREEAVDELLQLKLLQTILDTPPATIVLATGDGASSQFNPDGFVGCVRRAVDRGWMVELVAWEEGVSRAWKDLERDVNTRGARAKGGFRIVGLERWVGELVDL